MRLKFWERGTRNAIGSSGSARLDQVRVDSRDRALGTLPPQAWRLIHRADSAVLRGMGIRPLLNRQDTLAWNQYRPDPAGRHTVRDLQHIALASLILHGESTVERIPGGRFAPLPRPNDAVTDKTRYRRVDRWIWYGAQPFTLPDDRVLRLVMYEVPLQLRGISLLDDLRTVMQGREDLSKASVRREVLFSLYGLVRKRNSGIGATPFAERENLEASLDDDYRVWDIGSRDELSSQQSGLRPAALAELDRLLVASIAARAGLSHQSVSGDYGDANFSSHLAAGAADASIWGRYQDLILELTMAIYNEWDGRLRADANMRGWAVPHPVAMIDPVRFATAAEKNLANELISRTEVCALDGRDYEEVKRLRRQEGTDA